MTKQYIDMLKHILEYGEEREDRTGTGTIEVFGYQTRYDLKEGFPLLTTKNMEQRFNMIFHELKWFLLGDTNIRYLVQNGVNIWNADAYRWYLENERYKDVSPTPLSMKDFIECIKNDENFAEHNGDLGRIYGKQWTDYGGNILSMEDVNGESISNPSINQISQAINMIKEDPKSRRIIVNAWNPLDINSMALPPCHVMMQFYVTNDNRLSCLMYQRSADAFLGVPFNIASYALKVHKLAYLCGLEVGEFIHSIGCLHIYKNHLTQVQEQITRTPHALPVLQIKPHRVINEVTDFVLEDFSLLGYECHGELKGKVSVG